jgi:hypothetical protein
MATGSAATAAPSTGAALPVPGAARGARAFVESDWADAVMALHAAATGALAIVLAVAQNTSG